MPARSSPIAPPPLDAPSDADAIESAAADLVATARETDAPVVLAVSGGCDSMVLMHATAGALRLLQSSGRKRLQLSVASFDHGTGPHASQAAALVAREARGLRLPVRVGRGSLSGASEAEWRAARWRFLRETSPRGAIVATAHTRDDQLETIVMRVLRDAGARGLAGMARRSHGVVRPFLEIPRETVRRYGNTRGISFVEDPSNASRDQLRNRIRLDLLPAIDRLSHRFKTDMLALADRAATLRAAIDEVAGEFVSGVADDGALRVARDQLATYDSATLCVLWPAIAARALVTLDRRGTLRLAQFTTSGAPGARMQLSGGVEVFRYRETFVLRRVRTPRPNDGEQRLVGVVQFGGWRFRPIVGVDQDPAQTSTETVDPGLRVQAEDLWVSDLPADQRLSVRPWRAADRMRSREGGPARRVKRFFSDAKVPGPTRAGWPVVLADDEIVWIPGVRRTAAASERSGRPVVRFACERFDGGLSSS